MSAPFPTFQISQFPINGKAFTMAFQMVDPFFDVFWGI
jgi:hypothetical protein